MIQKQLTFMILQKKTKKNKNIIWPQIPDCLYRIFRTGGSESGRANSLFIVINQQPDTEKKLVHMLKINMKKNIIF